MAMLVVYCSTQARQHTAIPGSTSTYNSSSSAVSGVWLFFNVWAANAIRVAYPNLNTPAIFYTVFLVATSTWGPQFATVDAGASFVVRLLKSFFTAFGLATGANVVLFPVSCRDVFFKEAVIFLQAAQGSLKAYIEYMRTLHPYDLREEMMAPGTCTTPKATALEHTIQQLTTVHVKMQGDLVFARRETAIGYLGADHIGEMCKQTRAIYHPMLGQSAPVAVGRG
jgi:hypothetical protein